MSSDRFRPRPAGIPGDDIDVTSSLSGRVERTVLRAEVAALKSELERKERNHGLVIEQYEQLLESRCHETDDRQQGSVEVDSQRSHSESDSQWSHSEADSQRSHSEAERRQGRADGSVTSILRDHVSGILQP